MRAIGVSLLVMSGGCAVDRSWEPDLTPSEWFDGGAAPADGLYVRMSQFTYAQQPGRGAVVFDGGLEALVGIGGMTCEMATGSARNTSDYTTSDETDEVTDGILVDGEPVGLVVAVDVVSVVDDLFDGEDEPSFVGWEVPGVVTARFHGEGDVVALTADGERCGIGRVGESVDPWHDLPADACVAARPAVAGATVWVPAVDALLEVTSEEVTPHDTAADLAAWDASTSTLFTAVRDEPVLRAHEVDGTVRWQVDLPGPAIDLHVLGDLGVAGVLVDGTDGSRTLWAADALTGALTEMADLGGSADGVAAAPDGRTLAVTQWNGVVFFRANGW